MGPVKERIENIRIALPIIFHTRRRQKGMTATAYFTV
jgi:hypothetical protein